MSVAFRRESDEEHLEPSFAIPIPPGRNLVTVAGREAIAARVAELEALPPPVDDEKARKALLRDMTYWRQRLATAEVMDAPSGETVEFGCRVRLRLKGKDREIVHISPCFCRAITQTQQENSMNTDLSPHRYWTMPVWHTSTWNTATTSTPGASAMR